MAQDPPEGCPFCGALPCDQVNNPREFSAMLINEAGEPHGELKLKVCPETVTHAGLIYRLSEFSTDGAAYRFLKFDPAGPYGQR